MISLHAAAYHLSYDILILIQECHSPNNLMFSPFAVESFVFWFSVFRANDFLAYCAAELDPRTLMCTGTEATSRLSVQQWQQMASISCLHGGTVSSRDQAQMHTVARHRLHMKLLLLLLLTETGFRPSLVSCLGHGCVPVICFKPGDQYRLWQWPLSTLALPLIQ